MLSIEKLKEFGANTEEGLSRCMGMEPFYLKLVRMSVEDPSFSRLENAMAAEDYSEAFEACHALKGMLGNLGLDPLADTASELTEMLRPRQKCDCAELVEKLFAGLKDLKSIIEEPAAE